MPSNSIELLYFTAPWCAACKNMTPNIDHINKVMNIKVNTIDVNEKPDIANVFNIMSIPTVVILKNGDMVDGRNGVISIDDLKEIIKKHI